MFKFKFKLDNVEKKIFMFLFLYNIIALSILYIIEKIEKAGIFNLNPYHWINIKVFYVTVFFWGVWIGLIYITRKIRKE